MIFKQEESRRAWVFGPLAEGAEITTVEGIKISGDTVRFAKANFETARECEDWLKKNTAEDVMHVKSLVTQTKAIAVDDAEWDRMLPYMTNPENVKREDFRVYRSWLANNVIDRDRERFPKKMLQNFAATLPGKSKLFNHAWYDGTPEGRHYYAELVKMTVEEMLQMCGPVPIKNFEAMVRKAEEIDNGLFFLVGRFYVPSIDQELIFKIDAGIYSFESIGFRAPLLDPYTDENGNLLWYEYKEDNFRTGEATEGSWVFLGAQYGARTGKSALKSNDTGLTIEDIEDVIESSLSKRFNNPAKETKAMIKFKIAGQDYEVDPENAENMQEAIAGIEAKITKAESEAGTAREQLAATKKVLTAAGLPDDATEDQAKAVAADAAAHRAEVIEEAVKYGQLTGAIPNEEEGVKAHRETMAKLSTEEINRAAAGYKAIWEKANPPQGQIKEEKEQAEKKAPVEMPNAEIFGLPL